MSSDNDECHDKQKICYGAKCLHINTTSPPLILYNAPGLLYYGLCRSGDFYAFLSLRDDKLYAMKEDKILRSSNYYPSAQGWILIRDKNSESCCLWDVTTDSSLQLPPFPCSEPFTKLLLMFNPSTSSTSEHWLVVCADLRRGYLFYCHPNDSSWTFEDRRIALDGGDSLQDLVVCDGNLYALSTKKDLYLAQFHDNDDGRSKKLTLTNLHVERPSESEFGTRKRMVESCGDIFLVFTSYLGATKIVSDIGIYKLDLPSKVWNEVDTIGDRAFFLDCFVSASWRANEELGVKGNCIYYKERFDFGLYVLDLEKDTILRRDSCPCIPPVVPQCWFIPKC